MPPAASPALTVSFAAFAMALAVVVVTGLHVAAARAGLPPARRWRWTLRAAALAAIWMGLTWRLAASGVLADFSRRPPAMMLLFVALVAISVAVAGSRVGHVLVAGLPLSALVFLQAFRLPLELLMHQAFREGIMPVQMSYSGRNFDIVSGLTAIPVAWWLARGGSSRVAWAWNALGGLLLLNIIVVALRSTPVFAAYGPARLNTWVAYAPFVWLPSVMVLVALTGHLVLTRAWLSASSRGPRDAGRSVRA